MISDVVTGAELCMAGAPGTLFVETPKIDLSGLSSTRGALLIYNDQNYRPQFATTSLDSVPSSTELLSVFNKAVITGGNQTLTMQTDCTLSRDMQNAYGCSLISINNASYICSSSTTSAKNCSMSADAIELTAAEVSMVSFDGSSSFYSKSFMLSAASDLSFSTSVSITGTSGLKMEGPVSQISQDDRAEIFLSSSNNISLSNIRADRLFVDGNNIFIRPGALVEGTEFVNYTCANPVAPGLLTCDYSNTTAYDRLVVINGKSAVVMANSSSLLGSLIFICGNSIRSNLNSSIITTGMGCAANDGQGAGHVTSASMGGGGGAHSGNGGAGQDNAAGGGVAYGQNKEGGNQTTLFSGSGGGCTPSPLNYCNGSSYGGGIVSLRATHSIYLAGNITADGDVGLDTAGGGGGGSISIMTAQLTGYGVLSALGGEGGCSSLLGGGGGGGYIQVSNFKNSYTSFSGFHGPMLVSGGPICSFGSVSSSQMFVPTLRGDSSIQPMASTAATSGSGGYVSLPVCKAGTGNNPATGSVCQTCQIGFYSTGNGAMNSAGDTCLECVNAPTHSFYTDTGVTSSVCPFECEQGYSTDNCYNAFEKFLLYTLHWYGITGVIIGVFAIILVPLFAYRLKKKRDIEKEFAMAKGSTDFLNTTAIKDFGFGFNDDATTGKADKKRGEVVHENPILAGHHGLGFDDNRTSSIRPLHMKRGQELRREHRMADQDMLFHSARVNLLGCNHPFVSRGNANLNLAVRSAILTF